MKYPKFKGVEIPPYETFNFHDSEAFFSGAYGVYRENSQGRMSPCNYRDCER